MVAQKPTYLTKEGLARLEAELEHLHAVRRPEVTERLQRAKELAGTEENADYEDAKNEQSFVEGRILDLETLIRSAVLIQEDHPAGGVIGLGSHFSLRNEEGEEETYTLVGTTEANVAEGRISNESPVGRAVIGHRARDKVEVKAPAGVRRYTVLRVA